jgi:hypothetical protein
MNHDKIIIVVGSPANIVDKQFGLRQLPGEDFIVDLLSAGNFKAAGTYVAFVLLLDPQFTAND